MRFVEVEGDSRNKQPNFSDWSSPKTSPGNKSTRLLGNSVRSDRQECIFVGGITHLLFHANAF
jgi:hypothetical protein